MQLNRQPCETSAATLGTETARTRKLTTIRPAAEIAWAVGYGDCQG
jgi:hypothetical protein